jgi:hypothetical protein
MRKTMARTLISTTLLAASSLYISGAFAETMTPPRGGELSRDGQWVRMYGPEGSWAPAPHRLEFTGGKLAHTDSLDHEPRRTTSERRSAPDFLAPID